MTGTTPEPVTGPRYTGPVLVDPASPGPKLVTDYANPWGKPAPPTPEPANDRHGLIARLRHLVRA
jgi:hypothetical protein